MSLTKTDLDNAKLDVEHIAALATSPALTAEDRFGNVKETWTGVKEGLGAEYAVTQTGANRLATEAAAASAHQSLAAALAAGTVFDSANAAATSTDPVIAVGDTAWIRPNETDGLKRITATKRISSGTTIAAFQIDQNFATGSEFDLVVRPGRAKIPIALIDRLGRIFAGIIRGLGDRPELKFKGYTLRRRISNGVIFEIGDRLGRIFFQITTAGVLRTLGLEMPGLKLGRSKRQDYALYLTDRLGRIVFAITPKGKILTAAGLGAVASAFTPSLVSAAVTHFMSYGQSNSVGVGHNASSTTQPFNALMFNLGLRTSVDATGTPTSLVPLVESYNAGVTSGETPCAGFAQLVNEVTQAAGVSITNRQILMSAPGYGGRTVIQLSKGSVYYTQLLADITNARNLAAAAGKSYAYHGTCWTEGEDAEGQRMPGAVYKQSMRTLLADLSTDAKTITGRADTPVIVLGQMASYFRCSGATYPTIALAQLELAEEGGGFFLSHPQYVLSYADALHFDTASAKLHGALLARAYNEILTTGTWQPLRPIALRLSGRVITVKFNFPTTVDTSWVAAVANHGFRAVDANGNALTISSVVQVLPDTWDIVLSTTPAVGVRLQYAIANFGDINSLPGRGDGPRGNLRAVEANVPIFDPTGINRPLHRYCVMFDKPASV